MLELKSIRWKNLLATGNYWLEVNLCRAKKTLVVGPNGAGKTTLIEALCLVLYNRPFRKVNRAKLVNSITNKGLVVECSFAALGHTFKVIRGIKPNVFDIHKDGELVSPPADLRDHQKWLEESVLRMNFRTFCQVVILGSRNYVPFMQLTAAERRAVVENLLDIEVFSTMNALLKIRLEESRQAVEKSDGNLREIEAQIEVNNKRLQENERDYKAIIAEREKVITELDENFDNLRSEGEDVHRGIMGLKAQLIKVDENRHDQLKEANFQDDYTHKEASRMLEFFDKHATCPTCHQNITEAFRHSQISQLRETQKIIRASTYPAELANIIQAITANLSTQAKIDELESNLKHLVTKAKENRWHLESVQKDILNLRAKMGVKRTADTITIGLDARKHEVLAARDGTLKNAKTLSRAAGLLKDGGVKARVVRKFIPWLNNTVNKYLDAMDLFMSFEMDEEFNEKLYSRGRDDFTYDNLSEGEKLRLDLALLWAWRELGRARASASVNLLVLDEVLDSSLDAEGADDFMKVLDTMADSENVVVISHRGDNISDKFTRTLQFQKILNFSQLEEVA